MPRNRIKPLGTRNYGNYKPEILDECLEAIRSGELTQRAAETRYGIPRSTIKNKLKGRHMNTVGRARTFSDEEELAFEKHLITLSDYGFPVVETDFRYAVKCYLDKKGVKIDRFQNNLPGYEWTKSFLKRHEKLTSRLSSNIKKVRAEVGAKDIENYMENLKEVIENVPATHIWNYDETNLSDDPGNKKVICKRGAKYVENICNHSKSATSLMFSGNAAGTLLPPYVVYKADNMWTTWTENGPAGARYNRSKSGWFDAICFEDWFESLFLPHVRTQNGPKVIIGDNLSSHISLNVLRLCEENNVKFVCLPPNSTHLTQPLDVAFFSPMKKSWRAILSKWKESASGSKFTTIPKDAFPTLLKELMASLAENQERNLMAGFEKCGIHPFNKQKLLDRLPENQPVDNTVIGEAFLEQLEKKRAEYLTKDGPKKRKKKLQVPAGKSVSVKDVEEATGILEATNKPSSSKQTSSKSEKEKVPKKKHKQTYNSSSDEDDVEMVLESDGVSESFSDLEDLQEESKKAEPTAETKKQKWKAEDFAVDNFVIVIYNGQKYPGKIVSIFDHGPVVECMEKKIKFWRWPEKQDRMAYDWDDVWEKINPPKIASKRNQFTVPELDNFVE
ncbi:MFS-type transporter clz9-like isoform X3 [Chrysoperla carnea]|nr:MFS-type transporter clz9-like isoform X3 [Chrysoperla carnea]